MKKLFILFCAAASATAFPAVAQTFSTGTYNVRQLNAGDDAKGNGWQRRLPVIASLVRYHDFDIFGAQEVFHSQLEDLLGALPGYGYTGVGRDDGAEAGEYSVVFYKRDRFELLDSGHFWLAEDPSRPNKGWDAKYVRICCWGRFLDRETRERFWFFTLHTDHKGERAQVESCRLVLDKIRTMCRGERAVLTGDFNVGETSESYAVLRDSGLLSDTYDLAEIKYAWTGTENGFDPDRKTFRHIDYVFVTPGFRVLRYGILTDTYRSEEPGDSAKPFCARTPSDHFPVLVELAFAE